LIILLGDPSPREGDLLARAIGEQIGVQELAAIVSVQAEERHRQQGARACERLDDRVLAAMQQRQALGPAGGDIGEHERLQEGTLCPRAAVRDEISLEETGTDVIPTGEGAHRHLLFDEQSAARGRHAMGRVPFAIGAQDAIGGRRTEREELRTHRISQREMAMAFECRHQLGQKGHEALGADAIGRRPRDNQRVLYRATIEALARSGQRQGYGNGMGEEPDSVLARVAGDGDELIEDD